MFEDLYIVDNPQPSPSLRGSQENREGQENSDKSCPDNGHDAGDAIEARDPEAMPPLLYNRKAPQYVRQQELPWHRIALEKAAKGYTAREIASELGCSPTAVQDILRQPQYQRTQAELIRREGDQDYEVCETIKDNVVKAIKTLKEIMLDEKQSAAYRISAAKELLDRRYGKPNQPINRNTDVDLSQLSDSDLMKLLQHN